MRITEIYASIQGETQYAGLPCTLVRTTGCNLRCTYCDSAFAFQGGNEMTLPEILAACVRSARRWCCCTGGEPMLQREIGLLADFLLQAGYRVMIEMLGSRSVDSLPEAVVRIIDVKTPASGESGRMRWEVLDALRVQDAVKFVVRDEADYRWAADVHPLSRPGRADRGAALAGPRRARPAAPGGLDVARSVAGGSICSSIHTALVAGRARRVSCATT